MKKQALHVFFGTLRNTAFEVEYWDGDVIGYGDGIPAFKIIFHTPLPSSFDLSDPVLSIAEAYMNDIVDFQGDFDKVIGISSSLKSLKSGWLKAMPLLSHFHPGRKGSIKRQKKNIQHHYDLGNDFFSLWLDDSMSYSCAYFKDPADSIHEAQANKTLHILKKLQLKPGERLLDIGSGWGCLILEAARRYGAHATGITLSKEQFDKTSETIDRLGLRNLVQVKLMDYLNLDAHHQQYDKVVSVGMFEHVGQGNLYRYLTKVHEVLVPGGLSLLHSIMRPREGAASSWTTKYIFPGGYIPSLRETVSLFPDYDFHLLHAESLRMHYANTLEHWYSRFQQNWEAVEKEYGRRFARMWELYLRSAASDFRVTGLDVYQLLFSKGLNNDLPMTMEHVYR